MKRVGILQRKTATAVAAAILAVTATGVAIVSATPSGGFAGVVQARGAVSKATTIATEAIQLRTDEPFEIVTQTVTILPGGTSGWHSHPGPVFVAVKSGTVTVYDDTCAPHQYAAGQGFVEGPTPAVVRNEGTVDAVNIATLLVPTGSSARVDSPSLCPGIDPGPSTTSTTQPSATTIPPGGDQVCAALGSVLAQSTDPIVRQQLRLQLASRGCQ